MEKINFVNGSAPALNATNLNQMQTNLENAITEMQTNVESAINEATTKTVISETFYEIYKELNTGTWNDILSSVYSVNLKAGKYLIIISAAIEGKGDGVATLRPLINGKEISTTKRSTFPMVNSLMITSQVCFAYEVENEGAYTFNGSIYSIANCMVSRMTLEIVQI